MIYKSKKKYPKKIICKKTFKMTQFVQFKGPIRPSFSMSDFDPSLYEEVNEEELEEESEVWNISTSSSDLKKTARSKSFVRSKILSTSKSLSKFMSKKSLSRQSRMLRGSPSSVGEPASTLDDLEVQMSTKVKKLLLLVISIISNYYYF